MNITCKSVDVIYRNYGENSIVYNLDTNEIFMFNEIGSDIFDYIISVNGYICIDKIVDYVSSIYNVEESNTLSEDIISFIYDLLEYKLVETETNNITRPKQYVIGDNSNTYNESFIVDFCKKNNQIYSATIEITYKCNENCIHCYAVDNGSTMLEFNTFKRIITELRDLNCLSLSFTGGDPFVYPEFIDILKYVREMNFIFDVFTNGQFLADNPHYIAVIKTLRPKSIYISLYGSNGKTHDAVTRVPGSFEKTIFVIRELRRIGVQVVINIMIINQNYSDFDSIMKLVATLDVEFRIGLSIIQRNDGGLSPLSCFIKDKKTIVDIMRKGFMRKFYSMDRKFGENENDELVCGAGVVSICIAPDGQIYPCVSLKKSFGSILSAPISSIWYNPARLEYVNSLCWKNTEKCMSCFIKNSCPHCLGISQAERGSPFACNSCDRFLAECADIASRE